MPHHVDKKQVMITTMSRYFWIFTFLMIVLQSCTPTPSPEAPVIVAIPTATLTPSPTLPAPSETALPTLPSTPVPPIERVLIVSFDGLRPDAIAASKMENVLALMQSGAYTLS